MTPSPSGACASSTSAAAAGSSPNPWPGSAPIILGVDPSEKNILTARVHAEEQELAIDYRCATAEDLAAAGERFDVILNMEVIEHVANPQGFTRICC